MRVAAFTLAEVLITLGIIGIVAAMTLPAVINKANEFILKQQFKKAYSTITNAYNRVYADNEGYMGCFYTEGGGKPSTIYACAEFWAKMKEVLNPSTVCETESYKKGCIPKYNGMDNVIIANNPNLSEEDLEEKLDYQLRNCGGWFQTYILNRNSAWVLKDGSIILFYGKGESYIPYFAIDVNGNKSPNKWGYDIFIFDIFGENENSAKIRPSTSGCLFVEKGGKSALQMLMDSYKK